MKAVDLSKLDLPNWVWIVAAVSAVLILSGLIWGGPSSGPSRTGTDSASAAPAPIAQPTTPTVTASAPKVTVYGGSSMLAGAPARIDPVLKPRATAKACVCPAVTKPAAPLPVTPQSMFPVGVIRPSAQAVYHPYRQPREEFPSFGFGHKLWSFVGRYVAFDQAEVVPIGYNLEGRTVYAVANTAGPGSVLFVQSGFDPGRLAVYRHS